MHDLDQPSDNTIWKDGAVQPLARQVGRDAMEGHSSRYSMALIWWTATVPQIVPPL